MGDVWAVDDFVKAHPGEFSDTPTLVQTASSADAGNLAAQLRQEAELAAKAKADKDLRDRAEELRRRREFVGIFDEASTPQVPTVGNPVFSR